MRFNFTSYYGSQPTSTRFRSPVSTKSTHICKYAPRCLQQKCARPTSNPYWPSVHPSETKGTVSHYFKTLRNKLSLSFLAGIMSRSHLTGHQRLAYSPPCSLFPSLVHALTSSLSSPPSKTSTFSPRRLKSRYHPNNITSLCQTSSSDDNTQSSSTNDTSSAASKDTRPNLLKYKSQRSIISGEKRDVTAEEVNQLMVKAGKEVRLCVCICASFCTTTLYYYTGH